MRSLAGFRAEWLSQLRDAIEQEAREEGKDIVEGYLLLQAAEVLWSQLYGAMEDKFSPRATNPRIRALLRGTPALPNVPASKP